MPSIEPHDPWRRRICEDTISSAIDASGEPDVVTARDRRAIRQRDWSYLFQIRRRLENPIPPWRML